MKEIKLEGDKAFQAIQCYTMLHVLNNVMAANIEEVLDKEYTEEIAQKLTKGEFTAIAVVSQVQRITEQLSKDFEELTGISTDAFKVEIEQSPILKITEIDKKEEV